MRPRMIYTGIRVKDMEESVRSYTEILEMGLEGFQVSLLARRK